MNIYQQMGRQKQDEERRRKWLSNSKLLSKTYGMTEQIFKLLVSIGENPKKYLGATEIKLGGRK